MVNDGRITILTPGDTQLTIARRDDGKYIFSYQNGISNRADPFFQNYRCWHLANDTIKRHRPLLLFIKDTAWVNQADTFNVYRLLSWHYRQYAEAYSS